MGGDGSGDRKEEMFLIKKQFGILLLILLRKSMVAGQDLNLRPSGYETENAVEYIITHMHLRITQSA